MSKRPADEMTGGIQSRAARENGQEDARMAIRRGRGESGLPTIIYRDSEPLAGLQDRWRMAGGEDVQVEVVIPPDALAKDNKRVKSRQIWGDLVYTPDSDLVAVLMHMGYYTSTLAHPPQAVVEARAVIKLTATRPFYPSKQRFVKSRAWNRPSDGCAYTVERFWLATRSGCIVEMQPCMDDLPAPHATVQPQSSDRYITTRNTGAKGKMAQDVSVQFNLCNEPWLKYTLAAVADKGLKPSQLTSARLVDQVLFVETSSKRYQIARQGATPEDGSKELYSFSRCTTPLPASMMQRVGLPLPLSTLEVLETGLDWEDFQWGVTQLHVRGKEYVLKRLHLMRTCKPDTAA